MPCWTFTVLTSRVTSELIGQPYHVPFPAKSRSWRRRPWCAVRDPPSRSVGRRRSYRGPCSCACRPWRPRRRRVTRDRGSTDCERVACTAACCWSTNSSETLRSPLINTHPHSSDYQHGCSKAGTKENGAHLHFFADRKRTMNHFC